MFRSPGPGQKRNRTCHGHKRRVDHERVCVGADDGQLLHGAKGGRRFRAARMPESDPAGSGRIRRQEDRGAAGEFGDPGKRCRGDPLHSENVFLKFDYWTGPPRVPHREATRERRRPGHRSQIPPTTGRRGAPSTASGGRVSPRFSLVVAPWLPAVTAPYVHQVGVIPRDPSHSEHRPTDRRPRCPRPPPQPS